jgi:MoxR-like ATPase
VSKGERDNLVSAAGRMREELSKRIVGQADVIEEILLAIAAGGHALIVGVPGLAKTLMIRTLADAMRLHFRRIQFTPDLVPADITGTELMEEDRSTGHRSFRFVKGPIFANIVLADEINRAPPRTQAALLEAMQEHAVTTAGTRMPLPQPFFVLATQNPIEHEGTYPLPEAQLDRFLFEIRVSYPSAADEVRILRATTASDEPSINPVLDDVQTLTLQSLVRKVFADDSALSYAAGLARATRPHEPSATRTVKRYVRWGAGPRAGQSLILGAKANALLNGRQSVTAADIRRVAHPVLRHRILPNFAADAEGIRVDRIIDELLDSVSAPIQRALA